MGERDEYLADDDAAEASRLRPLKFGDSLFLVRAKGSPEGGGTLSVRADVGLRMSAPLTRKSGASKGK